MTQGYGVGNLKVDDFIKYCESVNIKTDARELEYYEKIGIMLPTLWFVKSCGGWTRTSDLQVMSSNPDSANFHTKLVFLICFRTCDGNEPEEL